jgi:MFS family permease
MTLPSFLTRDFLLLSLSSFLFFSSFNMLIPELPGYLASMGGEKYIGLIISLFTLTAGLSRPFSGKLADTIGRVPVMLIGVSVCVAMCTLYPLVTTVFAFLVLRFFHGFSTGFTPTGTSAYIADIVPFNRRGEALGLHSLFASLGMAAGPALGGWIASKYTVNHVFIGASVVSLLAAILMFRLHETLPNPQKMQWRFLKLRKNEIIEKKVLNPSLVLMLATFSFGTVLTIVPEFSSYLGLKNKGLFFAVFTLSSLIIRLLAGKASDRYGRVPVLQVAAGTMVLAMTLVSFATSVSQLMFGAIFFGFAVGMSSPTVAAWTIDLSDNNNRGRALATMYIALEAGIGLGALISGWLYQGNPERFSLVFMISGSTALMAFIYLFSIPKHQRLKTLLRRMR